MINEHEKKYQIIIAILIIALITMTLLAGYFYFADNTLGHKNFGINPPTFDSEKNLSETDFQGGSQSPGFRNPSP